MDLSVFILSLLSINCYYYTPILAENPKFTTCKKTTQCWRLTNITYPFYDGKTRPGYCGYPGFLLDCGSSTPQITISNQEYNLLDIDKTANTIKISVRNFNFTTTCPISPPLNTTIDFSSFFFTSADENITFFYDCAVPRPSLLQIQCDLLGSSLTGYYLTPTTLNAYNGRDFFESCKSVLIPVLQTQAELINKGPPTVATVVNAFRVGFDLGLTAAITEPCSSCVGSGGACGSDSGNFVCYCTDGDFHSRCGVDPVTREGTHNITALAVGASIGGLFLVVFVIGGWFLVLHQRKKHLLIAQEKTSQGPINGLQIANQVSKGPPSSQTYNTSNSTSTTYTHSSSSYTSSRPADERSCSYFGVPVFDYSELQQATDNFHESKELGSGGYGSVYYGRLLDGREVAVKRLYENTFKRMEQFMNEIEILAHLRHPNLVTLYGCTSRKSRVLVLVYEYVANGTVADHLHGKHAKNGLLEWPIRLSIAIETAEALAYLHRSDVIHRDVKTTNILLDNEFHVKVADFGLSRLFPNDATHVSTFPQGTPGYVDPEYYNCFRVTEKSDVYSFGVILMELISSMQAVDGDRGNHLNLASMALDRIQNRALHELVDPRIGFDRDSEIERMVKRVAELGFQCLQQDKDSRPTMEEVATTLRGIQLVEADLQKHEGMVCGDDVGLLKNTRTL